MYYVHYIIDVQFVEASLDIGYAKLPPYGINSPRNFYFSHVTDAIRCKNPAENVKSFEYNTHNVIYRRILCYAMYVSKYFITLLFFSVFIFFLYN